MPERTPTPVPGTGSEDTGQFRTTLNGALQEVGTAAPAAPPEKDGSSVHALAGVLAQIMEEKGNGNGGGGPHHKKVVRKNTWIIGLLVALFGAGGPVAGYYAIKALGEANEKKIEEHDAQPMHKEAGKRIEKIEHDLGDVKKDVSKISTEQTVIVEGIERLTKEAQTANQKRLERELEDAKRELRRRRRER